MVLDRKRIIISTIMGFLLLSGLFGAFGFAAASDDPDARNSMTFPDQRVGDRAVYSRTVVEKSGLEVDVLEREPISFGFQWHPEAPMMDAEGDIHMANVIHHSSPGQRAKGFGSDFTYYLDKSNHQPVANVYGEPVPSLGDDGQWRSTFDDSNTRQVNTYTDDRIGSIQCLGTPQQAGNTVDLTERVRLFGKCDLFDYWTNVNRMQAIDEEIIGEFETVHFMAWSGTRFGPDHILHVWMTESHPYPVRWAAQSQSEPNQFEVYQMTQFRAGTGAAIAWGEAEVERAPPVQMMERDFFGPSTSGLDLPFSPQDAFEAAMEHADAGELRTFMRDNPDAIIVRLEHTLRADAEGDSHGWYMELQDSDSGLAFTMYRDATVEETGVPFIGGTEEGFEYHYSPVALSHGEDGFWPIENTPQQLPTIEFMWERWAHVAGESFSGVAPNTFRLLMWCGYDDCPKPVVLVEAGYTYWDPDTSAFPRASALEWRAAYRADEVDEWSLTEHDRDVQSSPAGSGDQPTGGGEITAQSVAFDLDLWRFPNTASATVTAGFLSVFAALGYYFWPALKTLGSGLFSRVHDPEELLEHPVRQSMHEAITAHPGIHIRKLRDLLNTGRGATDHHLRKLEAVGLVSRVTKDGYTCLFVKGMTDHRIMQAAPVLKARGAQFLLQSVMETPGCTPADVGRATGLTGGTINYHMKRLEGAGLLEVLRDAGKVKMWPTAVAQSVVAGSNAVAA